MFYEVLMEKKAQHEKIASKRMTEALHSLAAGFDRPGAARLTKKHRKMLANRLGVKTQGQAASMLKRMEHQAFTRDVDNQLKREMMSGGLMTDFRLMNPRVAKADRLKQHFEKTEPWHSKTLNRAQALADRARGIHSKRQKGTNFVQRGIPAEGPTHYRDMIRSRAMGIADREMYRKTGVKYPGTDIGKY